MNENDNVVYGHFKNRKKSVNTRSTRQDDVVEIDDIVDGEEIVEIARLHGFDRREFENLVFEPWLAPDDHSYPDHPQNLALVEFDPAALYFAKIVGPFVLNPFVMAFTIQANFSNGEPWCFSMKVQYINHLDVDERHEPIYDADSEDSSGLDVTIRPDDYGYDIRVNGGLKSEFLIPDMDIPLQLLANLFGMQAADLKERRVH